MLPKLYGSLKRECYRGDHDDRRKMNIDERRKYLRMMKKRYPPASRKERSRLLDEMGQVTGLHRKSLVRLLKSDLRRKQRTRERERTYGVAMHNALRVLNESFDYVCAERLQPNLVWMAEQLAAHPVAARLDAVTNWERRRSCWRNWQRSASRRCAAFKVGCAKMSRGSHAKGLHRPTG